MVNLMEQTQQVYGLGMKIVRGEFDEVTIFHTHFLSLKLFLEFRIVEQGLFRSDQLHCNYNYEICSRSLDTMKRMPLYFSYRLDRQQFMLMHHDS